MKSMTSVPLMQGFPLGSLLPTSAMSRRRAELEIPRASVIKDENRILYPKSQAHA